ncbi:MarR family transcriptional regulator [Rhodococcus erythropolis]|uniref:MarR family winged helix-turn-helix transcriptional regulator n=1 Tax=Rhodococcus erythropolis TaxID=1833 RepID=UPI00294989D7|nr:MarR family transcriptional regulator [Rhodococcus erythropolis]MDV6277783.1 MarR family transcriptional regulator [Rhodococcus erythropolis]
MNHERSTPAEPTSGKSDRPDTGLRLDDITTILQELALISRRGRARAAAGRLSLVDHTLLTAIQSSGPCRAVDLAREFGLSRSTVSRQLAALIDGGLVEYADGGEKILTLTDEGAGLVNVSLDVHRDALSARVENWTSTEIHNFARALHRFNHG